jgi:ParB/RepB/Spo0J family partition protein
MKPALDLDQVRPLPLERVVPSSTNPRKFVDPGKLDELARSIETSGLATPILTRPFGKDSNGEDYFEIAAGHRRYEAFKKLGRMTIPGIVREMSDEEFRETQLVENLQREDIDPLDEADSYAALIDTLGTAAAIAARVGKTVEHVTRILKLRTLIPFSRQALADRLITIDHALLLAKIAPAEQEKALRFAIRPSCTRKDKTEDLLAVARKEASAKHGEAQRWAHYWEPQSVLHLKAFIEREIKLELKRAPWDLADTDLVSSAGSCAECPKNTAANTALFSDLAVREATCTDAECFNLKREAFVQVQVDAVRSAGMDAVRISWKHTAAKPSKLHAGGPVGQALYLGQVFKAGQWIEAKKGACGFVHTGVAVDFDESYYGSAAKGKPGAQLLVCVAAGCKVHKKDWERPEKSSGPGNQNSAENVAKREEAEKLAAAENAIRVGLVKQAVAKTSKLSGEVLRRVILRALPSWMDPEDEERFPGLEDGLKSLKVDSPEFARAAVCLLFVGEDAECFVGDWDTPDRGRKENLALLKVLGVDGASAWAKPATKVVTIPERKGGRGETPEPKKGAANQQRPASKSAAKKSSKAVVKKGGRK